jgi:hypothetical protein
VKALVLRVQELENRIHSESSRRRGVPLEMFLNGVER